MYNDAYKFAIDMIEKQIDIFKSLNQKESISFYHLGELIFASNGKEINKEINWKITLPIEPSAYHISNNVLAYIPYKIYKNKTSIILDTLKNMKAELESKFFEHTSEQSFNLDFNNLNEIQVSNPIKSENKYPNCFPQTLIDSIEQLNREIQQLYLNQEKAIRTKITLRIIDIFEPLEHSSSTDVSLTRTQKELFKNISSFIRNIYPVIIHKEKDWSARKMIRIAHRHKSSG